MQQKIKAKFDELTSTIKNGKQLKRSKDELIGQKMLQFCEMAAVNSFVENMITDYVESDKVLKKMYGKYRSASRWLKGEIASHWLKGYIEGRYR